MDSTPTTLGYHHIREIASVMDFNQVSEGADKASLLERQSVLWEEIQRTRTARQAPNFKGMPAFEDTEPRLSEEFTSIVRLLNSPMARFDPLYKLPLELFVPIIEESCKRDPYELSVPLLLQLTLVSDGWRRVIVDTPQLWTCVDFTYYNQAWDAAAQIHVTLTLSRDMPLSVFVDTPSFTAEARSLLLTISNRIVAFYLEEKDPFYSSFGVGEGEFNPLVHQLGLLAQYPNLATVQAIGLAPIKSSYKFLQPILANSPNIRIFDGLSIDERVPVAAISNLRYISCHWGPTPSTWNNLIKIKSLLKVDITSSRDYSKKLRIISLIEPKSARWTSFRCMGWIVPTNIIRSLRQVVDLSLVVSFQQLMGMVNILFELPNLLDLSLDLRASENPSAFAESPMLNSETKASRTIRKLEFRNDWGINNDPEMASKAEEQVATFLPQATPSVTTLSLSLTSEITATSWLRNIYWPRLQELYLSLSTSVDSGDIDLHLFEALRVVRLRGGQLASPISTLEFLELTPSYPSEDKPTDVYYPNLHSLYLRTSKYWDWSKACLPSLRSVTLGTIIHGWPTSRQCAQFCVELSRNPNGLPYLQEISFLGCFEVDILFVMLEERNIPALGVSKITSISTRRPFPSWYFHSLRDLLRGELSPRPSNYELSLIGNVDEYNDESM